MTRWGEIESKIVDRLSDRTVIKTVIAASTPNSPDRELTSTPAAIVCVVGSMSARGESWAVSDFGGYPFANDWIHFVISLRAGSRASLFAARDVVRARLQGWSPDLSGADKVMEPIDPEAELPNEELEGESLEMLFRMGVTSQEGIGG